MKHLQNYLKPRFWKSCFIEILYIKIIICFFFASPWPTGFEPTGVLTKSRFRSSGVTEWCWTTSQYSPSKSHPKKSTIIETSSKLSKTQILEELFYWNSLQKNHHLLSVLLHLDQPGLSPPLFLQKAGSGVVVLQNGVGQIHNIVHPNPTQNTHNLWNIFKIQFLPRFWKSCFIQILHIRIIISVCFASPWPTGFEPTGVLTKSRFRSSGVTECCWTNSQYSPSKSHPKNLQSLKHLQKLSETQILEELFYSNSSHKNHHLLFFFLHLDQPGLSPPEFLQKAGSGVVVLQNGVGQIHNVVHPNPTQKTHNHWNIFKII